jgi:Zn-dependent M28 family amino/carboxypeptidase
MVVFHALALAYGRPIVSQLLRRLRDVFLIAVAVHPAIGHSVWAQPPVEQAEAASAISEDAIRAHIQFLADDLLEGRGPGTRGDRLTQRYIATQFRTLGLEPALADGGWYQPVPLVGITTHLPPTVTYRRGDQTVDLKYYEEFIGSSGQAAEHVGFRNAEVVFVGYGIVAPEYDWNDYKDVDLTGKILLMMNNDPSDDPELFAGKRRLYYGRWDYKYEMAARQGAAGAIIIHTTASAGYPFQVVQTSWSGEEFELKGKQGPRVQLKSWVTEDAARKLVSLAGLELDQLRTAAEQRGFRPVPLGVHCSIDFTCSVRQQETANVLGVLDGSDPELSREMVIYMAHHDHLGMAQQRDREGDRIYNGAVDNATGVAALLAIAKAYTQLPRRPARSILFAAVGAEEQGLLGSAHMAAHPPTPAGYLAALVNIDGLNILGRTHDVNVIGYGKSSLDEILEKVAAWQHRHVTPDHFPDRGFYYRSDQFSLAKIGVPGVYLHGGTDVVGKPSGWGTQQREEWEATKYHQPSDEYEESWNLEGAIEDVRLLFHVGLLAANAQELPHWKPGDEFQAAREAALNAR